MNLIERVTPVKFSFFEKPPASSLTHAFVYVNDSNEYEVVKNGDRLTRSELRTGKYKKKYTVNVQSHTYKFEREVSSGTRGRKFFVVLHIDYAVEDPGLLVQQNAGDIGHIFENNLPIWVQNNAAQYDFREDGKFSRYLQDFLGTSNLVSVLKDAGITVRDVRVMITQGLRDQEHDEDLVDMDRDAEKSAYKDSLEHRQALSKAERVSRDVNSALSEGNFVKAWTIAGDNDMAKRMVGARVNEDETLRSEIKNQVLKIMTDSSIDQFEAKEQLAKLKILLPSLDIKLDENFTSSKESYDPMDELDSIVFGDAEKGERV
jgi:hypothetical protein